MYVILLFDLTGVFEPLFDKPLLPGLKSRLYYILDIHQQTLATERYRIGFLLDVGRGSTFERSWCDDECYTESNEHVIEPGGGVSVFTSALYRS
jgi:hypothetical protein